MKLHDDMPSFWVLYMGNTKPVSIDPWEKSYFGFHVVTHHHNKRDVVSIAKYTVGSMFNFSWHPIRASVNVLLGYLPNKIDNLMDPNGLQIIGPRVADGASASEIPSILKHRKSFLFQGDSDT